MIKVYFFDASAIVKGLIQEPGSSVVRGILSDQQTQIFTSWVLLGESLGVLKRKLLSFDLSNDAYEIAVDALFKMISDNQLKVLDVEAITGSAVLKTFGSEISIIRKRYKEIDAADALQLAVIKYSFLRYFVGKSQAQLVTADGRLADIAESIGIKTIHANK